MQRPEADIPHAMGQTIEAPSRQRRLFNNLARPRGRAAVPDDEKVAAGIDWIGVAQAVRIPAGQDKFAIIGLQSLG
jgi:hypothetical protein